ncbi:sigma-54-dependent Fis family transcriptional regulator [Burkholderiaceae bacterium FT117]|uniref:sigma-54-dependent Fis family transcriptional regulator n=1 Tax=Zeimonas sediminis TaxID=2944268 RepID=UPI0023431B98|nr:sigma-54-dependent Fis family transcriptional regulator [Zeimonas sediminis]MCM5569311.1 sigma-54-dependent Fis family transcriptional regulator [Zeimonas sediminis]
MNATAHTGRVLARVSSRLPSDGAPPLEARIVSSWERCLNRYGLQPDRVAPPTVLTSTELKDHCAPIEDLIALSRGEIERLHARLADQGYMVMLSDANGLAVQFLCGESLADECARASVLPGSIWSEAMQGTNGIGLCIAERKPVSVVMDDHFAAWLTGLSCTVAPIFGAEGRLAAVLNVTTLHSTDHGTQSFVRDIVCSSARRIENLHFDRMHARRQVVRLSPYDDFCDSAAEARLALDASGRIVDATPEAARLLGARGEMLIGTALTGVGSVEDDSLSRVMRDGRASIGQGARRLFLRLAETGSSPAPAPARAPASARGGLRARDAGEARARVSAAPPGLVDLIGGDPAIAERVRMAQRFVDRRLPVLLQGETGTGKSALARALHDCSAHRSGAFVSINCAAIPRELIESELFGHRPGAFTGAARQGARGRLLEADGGTLFLDEIGDMPLELQSRLLHVLSDGEFVPLGASSPVSVRFSLVSASHRDIGELVALGRFREDLFYRLAGATLALPALRDRSDRRRLIERVFAEEAAAVGQPEPVLDAGTRALLASHAWPGNLRELRHVARFALAMSVDGFVDAGCLPPPIGEAGKAAGGPAVGRDRTAIEAALARARWNVSLAARSLGVSRATLHRRIAALGLERPARSRG